jgi:hypothetical protein
MAPPRHRIYGTQRIHVAKTVRAPLKYVYDWCTDYRSDDGRFARSPPRPQYRVVKLSAGRLLRIRLTDTSRADPEVAVDLVRLTPPDAWHTDQIDEGDLETVDYRLTTLGPQRTRLDLLITERWLTPRHPSREELRERAGRSWDRYVAEIESRYRAGTPAKG